MSKPSHKYFDLVERWILGGLPIEKMYMSPDQHFRAMLAYEAYQVLLQYKQIRPTDLMRRLAALDYPILLQKAAEGNERAIEFVKTMHIRPGVPRTVTEISNDVALFNHLVGRFNTPIENIEKAKVQDASDWLIREGMKMGDARAEKAGSDIKMQMHDNFREKEDPTAQMPSGENLITGDVTVIKRDRVNYTEEEKQKMGRQFGLSSKQVTELFQQPDGSWQMPEEQPDNETSPDIFDEQPLP